MFFVVYCSRLYFGEIAMAIGVLRRARIAGRAIVDIANWREILPRAAEGQPVTEIRLRGGITVTARTETALWPHFSDIWYHRTYTKHCEIPSNSVVVDIGAKSDYFNHTFGAADLNANLAPGYEFAKTQGEGAVTNMANSMDGLGGNSLAEISKWTTGFAQQGYQQAYENYTKNQTNIFNRLASIAGLGQTAGSASATGAPAFASGISSTIQGAGNAQAAGTVGGANAITGGINNAMGWYQLNNLMNRGGTSGATTGGGP